ncbi:MAG: DUF4340 domain-containing protein [Planctomycetota bacterium]|nr:DUF4340 domain-containing protein [Planctomycetota bacterium]
MTPRNLSMLLAIIIGAGLLFYFEKDPYSEPTEVPVAIAAFTQLDVQQVARVEMMQGTHSVVLERQGDSWSVPSAWDYAADHQEINQLLTDIRSIAAAQQRASKVASHSTFDVNDEAGLKIALKDSSGQTMTDLVLGKRDGFGRSFIRIAGSNEVYSVSPNLRARAAFAGSTLEAGRWTDKMLFRLPADAVVRRMHIETPEGLSQLVWKASEKPPVPQADENPLLAGSEDPLWMVRSSTDGELLPADETTVKGIISSLNNVQAAWPIDPSDMAALGLDPASSFIEVELSDGSIHTIQFGQERELPTGGQGFTARVVGDHRTVMVRQWIRDSLLKGADALRAAQDPPQDPGVPEEGDALPVPEQDPATDSDG